MNKEITKPVIHLNGTAAETLLEDNIEARRTIEDAISRIQKMEFNGRDYYPVAGSFEKARDERMAILTNLRDASDYFLAIAEHCSEVVAEREARKAGR